MSMFLPVGRQVYVVKKEIISIPISIAMSMSISMAIVIPIPNSSILNLLIPNFYYTPNYPVID